MKILLAPSETKKEGGNKPFDLDTLLLNKELKEPRVELIKEYVNLVTSGDLEKIAKLTGIKKPKELEKYTKDITKEPTLKAIERYTGVAFDYIDYPTLSQDGKKYIDENVIIFSNLFGAIRASDYIPLYKIKQGETLNGIKIENIYKKRLQEPLDSLLEDEDILDIRAGYYNKFYKPSKFYTTLKFLKNGKVVSHWAKAYRGLVLREIAQKQIKTIKDFIAMPIANLNLLEIKESKNSQEIIYEIDE